MPKVEVKHAEGREFYDDGYDSCGEKSISNRLDFSEMKFYGREEELRALTGIYQKVCKEGRCDARVPLISGFSGSGKSALVKRFLEEVNSNETKKIDDSNTEKKQQGCCFLSGKYEELQCADPLSAIVQAFSGLPLQLMKRNMQEVRKLKDTVRKEIGSRALVALTNVIPGLSDVIGSEIFENEDSLDGSGRSVSTMTSEMGLLRNSNGNAWNLLRYVLKKFIQAICTRDYPVVMFLDDLQWADSSSINLIANLVSDTSLTYFMFIGAVRSNEVSNNCELSSMLKQMENQCAIERIDLRNLSIDEIGEFIGDLLNHFKDDTKTLTDVIYRKTQGNVFFAIQMLEDLERRNLLVYSMISFEWEWNQKEIETQVEMSNSVVDLVASKIQSTPDTLQNALIVAAYTRSTIEVAPLHELMRATGFHVEIQDLVKILDLAVQEGMLSIVSVATSNDSGMGDSSIKKRFKFAHDRIQQAAHSLVPAGEERDKFREKIGRCLLELARSSEIGEDWMLFIAADHLNSISGSTKNKMMDDNSLTELNLEVGLKSMEVAAFAPASTYFNKALTMLQLKPNHWAENYDLSLQLYQAIANVELILGHFEVGEELGKQVLLHARSGQDKLPIYQSLALALGRQERHAEALEWNWKALPLLGETRKRSRNALLLVKDFIVVNSFFKSHTNEEILDLPLLDDVTVHQKMIFYDDAGLRAIYCGNLPQFVYVQLRKIRLSIKYGICGSTALSFASYAILVGELGDHTKALRLSQLARQVLNVTEDNTSESSKTLFFISYLTESWSNAGSLTIENFRVASKTGMEAGDIEFGFLSWLVRTGYEYLSGLPLVQVDKSHAELELQLRLYRVDSSLSILSQRRVVVRHLLGHDISNNYIDWKELSQFGLSSDDENTGGSKTYFLLFGYLGRAGLAVFFRHYEFAIHWVEQLKKLSSHDTTAESVTLRLYYSGLIFAGLAKQQQVEAQTSNSKDKSREHAQTLGRKKCSARKYIGMARKEANQLKRLWKIRGVQSPHRHMIMEAEILAATYGYSKRNMQVNMLKIKEAYDCAIQSAVKTAHIHDAALCNELAGEYFFSLISGQQDATIKTTTRGSDASCDTVQEEELARAYISKARDLYQKWGAKTKVAHINSTRGDFLDSTISQKSTTSFQGVDKKSENDFSLKTV